MKTIITSSEEETADLATELIKKLHGGQILGLIGDLGAGKTALTRGMARMFGIKQKITSPTFVLMKIYHFPKPVNGIKQLCHIDAYRTRGGQALLEIGADEYWHDQHTLTVIEWADKVRDVLPKKTKIIQIKHGKENSRTFHFF